jgi:tRNA (mo5U34)-methyltransferase
MKQNTPALSRDELRSLARSVRFWYHSIDLGQGVVTDGRLTQAALTEQVAAMRLPDLRGKRVLDVGCWDGFFALEAERREAAEVVALDHFVWELDLPAYMKYFAEASQRGQGLNFADLERYRHPGHLPGKVGFDTAKRALDSRVEPVVADYMSMDVGELGSFDVVFFLGVLYHLTDPFGAIRRLSSVTSDLAVIESALVQVAGMEDLALAEFWGDVEYGGDPTNWWGLSLSALDSMCRAAGFGELRPVNSQLRDPLPRERRTIYRALFHAHKPGRRRPCPCDATSNSLQDLLHGRANPSSRD